MTQDQQNMLQALKLIAADMNELKRVNNLLANVNEVISYAGDSNTIMTASGRCFVYRKDSTADVDNVMVFLAPGKGNGRWEAVYVGGVDLSWFGALGDGISDDTSAVQKAINYVLKSANPVLGELPNYTGNTGTLLVAPGTYKVANVVIKGTIRMIGQGGGTYAGSTFLQAIAGVSMFILDRGLDGSSNSTVFENICFKSGSATSSPTVAQVRTVSGISSNSIYFRNCWFKTPENLAIWLTQGDDIQITGCTFDVCPFHAIRLGSELAVTNCTITNNTFYRVSLNHIELLNVQGVSILGNRAYNNDNTAIATAVFVNGLSATAINGLTVVGNELNNVPSLAVLPTLTRSLVLSGNSGYKCDDSVLALVGGGILYGATITGNSFFASGAFAHAPITGPGCGLQGSIISSNTFFANTVTPLGINLSDARVTGNVIDKNAFSNVTAIDNLLYPHLNGQTLLFLTKAGVPTTTEVPSGFSRIVYNTSDGSTKLYFNQGGALKSIALT